MRLRLSTLHLLTALNLHRKAATSLTVISIFFLLGLSTNSFSQIATMSDESNPELNQQLRRTKRRLNILESATIDLTTDVTGVLPLINGGTGAALTDPGADRILFWDDSDGSIEWLVPNDNLEIVDNNLNVTGATGFSNVIFLYVAVIDNAAQSQGEYIGNSLVPNNTVGNYRFLQTDVSVADVVLTGKWVKIASVNTITYYADVWNQVGFTSTLTVDVGGKSSTVTETAQTPQEKTNTIDLTTETALVDGTTYDITIKLNTSNGLGEAYLGNLVLLGS